jgi:hypothetical protein
MIIPRRIGASNSMRNTIIAIIITKAIIPIIIAPIVAPNTKIISKKIDTFHNTKHFWRMFT